MSLFIAVAVNVRSPLSCAHQKIKMQSLLTLPAGRGAELYSLRPYKAIDSSRKWAPPSFPSKPLGRRGFHTHCSDHGIAAAVSSVWIPSDGNGRRRRSRNSSTAVSAAADSSSDGSSSGGGGIDLLGRIASAGELISMAFPMWVALACVVGLCRPSSFLWLDSKWQIPGITLTMLGMGMTLTLNDLRGAISMPKELLAGFVLQYTVMPLSGFFVSKLLRLPSHYAAGLILVGCCPGGTASNIVTYLARGNVALSVLMTAASTISAVVMTPFLTAKLAGQFVAVDAAGLFFSTLQVVLAPVLFGAFMNQYFHGVVKVVSPIMPVIAVVTVALLCGSAIAQNATAILISGWQVVLACCALHASGFFFGYILSRMLGLDISSSRTISIEVGMQNSVLGVVLAGQHFKNPLTAVPCAVSSVCHSIYGSVLAGIWRCTSPTQNKE